GDTRCIQDRLDRLQLTSFQEPQDEIWSRLDHVAVDLAGLQLNDDAVGVVVEIPAGFDDADVALRLVEPIDDEAPRVAAAGLPPEPTQQFQIDFAPARGRARLGEANSGKCTPQRDCSRNSGGAFE